MPQELLEFLPSYLVVGFYRLMTDKELFLPIYNRSKSTLKKALLISLIFSLFSFPITKVWVRFFMRKSSIDRYYYKTSAQNEKGHDGQDEGSSFLFSRLFSIKNFITISLVLSQISFLIEFFLKRTLKELRDKSYEMTIRSRSKDSNFWIGYIEEWEKPPIEKAKKRLKDKKKWYSTVSRPLFRIFLLRVILIPLHFVPFLNLIISSFLNSLTLSEKLLEPYFESKKMSLLERSVFMIERENSLRLLGFIGSVLERVPLIGLIFSISNRIGFGMLVHDLEKRQHLIFDGKVGKRKEGYQSKSKFIELDVPRNYIGNFPKKYDDDEEDNNNNNNNESGDKKKD